MHVIQNLWLNGPLVNAKKVMKRIGNQRGEGEEEEGNQVGEKSAVEEWFK